MNKELINNRIEVLRELMMERNIDYYIVPTSDPHGSEYIDDYYKSREFMTGFTGSAGTLVVSKMEACLFVDGRYHIQAEIETEGTEITLMKLGQTDVPTVTEYLYEKSNDLFINNSNINDSSSYINIGFDGRSFDETTFEKMQKNIKNADFQIEEDLVDIIWNNHNINDENLFFDKSSHRSNRNANSVYLLDDYLISTDTNEKIEFIRKYLKEKHIDLFFVSELSDIMWLFNIRGSDIKCNPVAFSYAFITNETAILFIQNGTYDEVFTKKLLEKGIFIADYDEIELELAKIKGKTVCFDKNSTSCLNAKILSCGNEIKSVKNYKLIKKYIKDKKEIEFAKKYHEVDAVSMIKFIIWVKNASKNSCINEYEAAMKLDSIRSENEGFIDISFDTIVAYKENAAIVHYSPSKDNSKNIESKGLLLVDSGAQYMGATTDITRTIVLGDLTEEEKISYTLVLKGNLKLMDAVFLKGTKGENLDILARTSLWKAFLDYRHGTGHGIGSFLNVHEGPCSIRYRINRDNIQPDFEPGIIISDEPGYYKDNEYGIRHETQLLCVSKSTNEYGDFLGFEPLSLVPFERSAIINDLLTYEETEILNNYHKLCYEKLYKYFDGEELDWIKEACKEI